jgi:hypothetical protein
VTTLVRSQFPTCHSPNQRSQPRDGKDEKAPQGAFLLAKYLHECMEQFLPEYT